MRACTVDVFLLPDSHPPSENGGGKGRFCVCLHCKRTGAGHGFHYSSRRTENTAALSHTSLTGKVGFITWLLFFFFKFWPLFLSLIVRKIKAEIYTWKRYYELWWIIMLYLSCDVRMTIRSCLYNVRQSRPHFITSGGRLSISGRLTKSPLRCLVDVQDKLYISGRLARTPFGDLQTS